MKFENHLSGSLFIGSNTYMRGEKMHLCEEKGNSWGSGCTMLILHWRLLKERVGDIDIICTYFKINF